MSGLFAGHPDHSNDANQQRRATGDEFNQAGHEQPCLVGQHATGGRSKQVQGVCAARREFDRFNRNKEKLHVVDLPFQLQLNLALGVLLKNPMFVEAEPEFQQLATFHTKIKLRNALPDELIPGSLTQTSAPKQQEALLISLKRPIVFVLPKAFDKGTLYSPIKYTGTENVPPINNIALFQPSSSGSTTRTRTSTGPSSVSPASPTSHFRCTRRRRTRHI